MRQVKKGLIMEKCKGHIMFKWDSEYFVLEETGSLYRAPASNPIDPQTGYRLGARWQTKASLVQSHIDYIKSLPDKF